MKGTAREKTYNCCQYAFSEVTYKFVLERKPLYHIVYLIVPCTVISALVLVNFVTPADSGERISLCMTILLAMSVYLMNVGNDLPQESNDLPLLGLYYIATMFQISCAVVATAFVLRCHHTSEKPPMLFKWMLKREKVFEDVVKGEELSLENDGPREKETERPQPVTKDFVFREMNNEEKQYNKFWVAIGKQLDKLFLCVFFVILILTACAVFLHVPQISNTDKIDLMV